MCFFHSPGRQLIQLQHTLSTAWLSHAHLNHLNTCCASSPVPGKATVSDSVCEMKITLAEIQENIKLSQISKEVCVYAQGTWLCGCPYAVYSAWVSECGGLWAQLKGPGKSLWSPACSHMIQCKPIHLSEIPFLHKLNATHRDEEISYQIKEIVTCDRYSWLSTWPYQELTKAQGLGTPMSNFSWLNHLKWEKHILNSDL